MTIAVLLTIVVVQLAFIAYQQVCLIHDLGESRAETIALMRSIEANQRINWQQLEAINKNTREPPAH